MLHKHVHNERHNKCSSQADAHQNTTEKENESYPSGQTIEFFLRTNLH